MYEQATIAIENQPAFAAVRSAMEQAFSSNGIDAFLRLLDRGKLRVRHFEEVLAAGALGPDADAAYRQLGGGDGGMIRELYLSLLEKVDPELRRKYLKVYAYY